MRRQAFLAVAGALGLCGAPAWAAKTNFTATLNSDLAPADTGVTGSGVFTYDDATHVLCGRITVEGEFTFRKLELNEAFEPPATAPASSQDLTPAMTTAKDPLASPIELGVRITPDALSEALLSELTYINIRSQLRDDPIGVASGGLVKAGEGSETVTCAAQTNAPIVDSGTGTGTGTPTDGAPSGAGAGTFDAGIHDLTNDDGGCSTAGTDASFAGNCGLLAIAGLGLALVTRARRRR